MNPNAENTQHLNRFGGTCSFGYRTKHTQTDVGVMVAHGTGRDVTTSLDLQSTTVAGISQTLTYVFLASTYQF
jgi:hypothetical protein